MCLEQAIRLDPDDAVARVDLGNALTRARALEPAIVQYEAALRLRPDWRAVADHLATLRQIRGGATPGRRSDPSPGPGPGRVYQGRGRDQPRDLDEGGAIPRIPGS